MIFSSQVPTSLASLVNEPAPSVKTVTAQEAAAADFVLVAVHWADIGKVPGNQSSFSSQIGLMPATRAIRARPLASIILTPSFSHREK